MTKYWNSAPSSPFVKGEEERNSDSIHSLHTRCYTGPYMGNEVMLTHLAVWLNSGKHADGEAIV